MTAMDLEDFREATRRFYAGKSSVKEYKSISGGFGSYAQKGMSKSMVRLRLVGGAIDVDRLRFIVESIERYGVDFVHQTTCQAVQLHGLDGEDACNLVKEAIEHGIMTLGGGGDFPRNVTASPLSGVEIDECFDILPYARVVEGYLLSIIGNVKLPRKLKVGFSNSKRNEVHATFRDLGFLARSDGRFDVYSAGGLGKDPRMGLLVAEDVDPTLVLYYVRAMVRTFVKHGDYENRSRARTRYMQETLGEEGYRKAFCSELEESLKYGGLDMDPEIIPILKKGKGSIDMPRVHSQKQDGLYYVEYHAVGGDPRPGKFREIYETIKDMPGVELRTSPDQTLYIINCNAKEAERVQIITDDGAINLFETSVSCVGSTICQQGLRDSRGLLDELVEMSRRNTFRDGVLPRIRISGCTSSCAAHQIGIIGLQGTSVRDSNGESQPAFLVSVNGSHMAGEECFGTPIGKILQKDVPSFLEDVGKAVESQGSDFRSWYPANVGEFERIAKGYLVGDTGQIPL